ncbi:metabotropic glutamate receptor 2-like [Stylophora pistillata]|nr:metabotropic glutamate receptor 2-like [Stylophora pistillata]
MKKTLNMLMTTCLFCWLCRLVFTQNTKEKTESLSYAFTKGDFVIGGLSPVHFSPTEAEEQQNPDSFTCQGRLNTRGFEAVEAMLFTMDMLNEGPLKDVVLPNITIGMDIKDTCGSADYAVRESLNFSFIRNAHVKDQCGSSYEKEKFQTIAVVGAAYSGVSMAVTNLCGLFYVPVVSYASTSSLLSNKVRFRYFLRTVPNDMLQAKVMADLVRKMKWNYVITLASESEYGRSGIEAFKRALDGFGDSYDVCIPVDKRFTKRSTDAEFEEIFQKMRANSKARVVILFAQLHDAKILIDKFRQHESMSKEKYVWIGSDAWGDSKQVLKGNEDILRGMFGVVPEVVHIKEFDKYFTSFTDKRRKRNPWMREYEYLKVAHNPAFYRDTFEHYPKAQYVMDAVLAVAYALHNMLGCQPYQDCSKKITKNFKQRKFLEFLEDVKFPGKSREQFSFDYLGEAIGVYDIGHLGLGDGNYDVVKAGKWGGKECDILGANLFMSSCLDLDMKIIDMVNENLKNHTQEGIPFSKCSKDCPPGYHKNPEKNHAKCCWECRLCSGNTITKQSNMDDCTACPQGYRASKNHSRCEPIQPTSLHWNDTLGVIIICISGAGILSVICTLAVYYVYRETPVVRASSKELCYILLFGIAWCYATPIAFLVNLTDQVCRTIPFVTGLSPALIAGTLLTKTNRISRIFNRKLLKTGTPSFLSKKWQVLMVLCLAGVECLIGGGCVLFSETGSKLLISESKKEVLKQCKELPDICTVIWWVYNMGLALTCTYQAFRTRKLPENYNEAKFITFTMVITCIVVIIFIPTYIGTKGIYRTTITCFVFIIGGSSTLCCMFVPKLYIILWRPEKNVPMQPRSSTIRLGTISPSASFVKRLSVDSNFSDKAGEGRKTRIHSLPTIELSRPEDEDGEHQEVPRVKKTTRSFSLSPDMLSGGRTNPERGPERSPTRLLPSRRRSSLQAPSAMLSSMEMIEEGNEVEQFGASSESATRSGAIDSRDLRAGLERLKLELYELQEKDDRLNAEDDDKKSCEDDVFLLSDVENQNDYDYGDEFETSNGDSESKNPTTCASNLDNCQPETQTTSTSNSLSCQNCGTIVSNNNRDFLIEVLRAHLARKSSSQPGEKTKKHSENSQSQHGDVAGEPGRSK